MKESWNWATNSALKRSFVILGLVLLAFFSAFFWPRADQKHVIPIADGVIGDFEYPVFHRIGDMGLYIDNDQEFGYFALISPGSGWVAIGFSPKDFHMGANFLFFSVVDGEILVSDQYGVNQFLHESDLVLGGSLDIVDYAGVEDQGTVVEFKFKLNSGDDYDTVLEIGKSYSIIVAYNENDDNFETKHSNWYKHTISILRE
ncbi:MAG: DOMON domain-containing protein [Promethearchaeota archaeon]